MVKEIKLSNGLRIVFDKNENVKTCAFDVAVACGSSYETPETAGFSHFIEHMLFKGTQSRSALQIAVETDGIGGRINAYTSTSLTCVYAHILSEHTLKAMELVFDMITHPAFTDVDVETEKGVIREEIAMYKDSPEDVLVDTFYASVWKGSPLSRDTLGPVENIEGLTREKLLSHMRKFYVPERMIISVSGNFDEDKVFGLIDLCFSGMKNSGFEIEHPTAVYQQKISTVRKNITQNQLLLGFEGISIEDSAKVKLTDYIDSMLAGRPSSRLFQLLREKHGLVYEVDINSACLQRVGVIHIGMALGRESEQKAIEETLRELSTFPETLTEKEFTVARENIITEFAIDGEKVTARAYRNMMSILNYGHTETEESRIEQIRAVTPEQVSAFAKNVFDLGRVSLCAVGKVHTKKEYKEFLGF